MEDTNKKQSKAIIIGIIVASVTLIMLIGSGAVYIYLQSQDDKKNEENEVKIEATPIVSTIVEQTDVKEIVDIKTYTNPNYPSLSFEYPSSWTVSEEFKDEDEGLAPTTGIFLMKGESTLKINLLGFTAGGWSNTPCYTKDQISIAKVGSWEKVSVSDSSILRNDSLFLKDNPNGVYVDQLVLERSEMEKYLGYEYMKYEENKNVDDYAACGELGGILLISSIFKRDEQEVWGLLSISFNDKEADQETKDEMDAIVNSLKYTKYIFEE